VFETSATTVKADGVPGVVGAAVGVLGSAAAVEGLEPPPPHAARARVLAPAAIQARYELYFFMDTLSAINDGGHRASPGRKWRPTIRTFKAPAKIFAAVGRSQSRPSAAHRAAGESPMYT
jgi:hypothetical protein